MKGSGKILVIISGLMCLALFYVHLQIAAFVVSFEIHNRSRVFNEKQEQLRQLQFKVDQLKAPQFLEERMKKHDLNLGLPNKVELFEIPPTVASRVTVNQPKATPSFTSALASFVGRWIQTAQAKTETPS